MTLADGGTFRIVVRRWTSESVNMLRHARHISITHLLNRCPLGAAFRQNVLIHHQQDL